MSTGVIQATDRRHEPGASPTRGPGPFNVVIAGGGVAAIETAIALRRRAGGRVRIALLAPNHDLKFRPGGVVAAVGGPESATYPLASIATRLGGDLVRERLAWVDRWARVVHTEDGNRMPYDALALCLGATARPRFQRAITFTGDDDEQVRDLVGRAREGRIRRLAFIVPERMAWPLPLYELALLTAAQVGDDNPTLEATFITSERAPLEVFGNPASRTVSALLGERGIKLICGAKCRVREPGRVQIAPLKPPWDGPDGARTWPPRDLTEATIISLPELYGPHVRGLPVARHGFIPIDTFCRVRAAPGVFAAGDATDFAVKHGGLAAQQGDVVADGIAALAGTVAKPLPFRPVIQGTLMTGGEPRHLSARLIGGHSFDSYLSAEPTWTPPSKVAAKHLGPFLEQLDT